ncbi:hypothetical protein CYMTET_56365 [Cymbomonas tetramitiformis]|uniref:1-phosphatidylinositol-4-phosphate 5-kinase n=1 Tax=Cymbomonas tetramitiformis TaxID=36881 RepID=A0AAE0BCH0_9CHLO|nr:hypothetical protein CYMTET_56365 [Cymbomonas tetramitiformis]
MFTALLCVIAGGILPGTYRRIRRRFSGNEVCKSQAFIREKDVSKMLLAGIRRSLGHQCNSTNGQINFDETIFNLHDHTVLDSRGSEGAIKFTNWFAEVTLRLRTLFGISEASFLASLSRVQGEFAIGEGKGGSLFVTTQDSRFILKTVKKSERVSLHAMMYDYATYVNAHPSTLLPWFMGYYTLTTDDGELTVVVMPNLLPPKLKIQARYDLKGSLVNRLVGKAPEDGDTLKDLDWLNRKQTIALTREDEGAVLQQLQFDSAFLTRHNIMDQSLLLCIHRTSWVRRITAFVHWIRIRFCKQRHSPSRFHSFQGGIPNISYKEVYYFGIIDVLQSYNYRKKAENALKSFTSGARGIVTEEEIDLQDFAAKHSRHSAVAPEAYEARFLAFMREHVFLRESRINSGEIEATEKTLDKSYTMNWHCPRSDNF